jgi:hypothetical protein
MNSIEVDLSVNFKLTYFKAYLSSVQLFNVALGDRRDKDQNNYKITDLQQYFDHV